MRKRPTFRRELLIAAALLSLLSGGCRGARTHHRSWPPLRPGYASPIAAENALPGDPTWADGLDAASGEIEGYADRVSARAGETVQVMVQASAPHQASWALYRLGWYAGDGARKAAEGGPFAVGPQPPCPMDPTTGQVQCGWSPSFQMALPGDAVSGLYVVKLARDDGLDRFVPLVVVDDRPADLLLQAGVNTYQGYNRWGGASLYVDATKTLPRGFAVTVSFDRPYAEDRGAGLMMRFEVPFARFLERNGYDVSYTTNTDVSTLGWRHLYRAGAFLSAGHDEYWTGEERDAVERARDQGVPLLFFGANDAYWKVRYDDPGNPRALSCYRDPKTDPVQGAGVTGRFRDQPVDRPENALLGVMYDGWMRLSFPWVVTDASSWLYRGTGLQAGDTLAALVGYEFDRTADNGHEPPGLEVLSRSPVVNVAGVPSQAEAATYRTDSGTMVFAAGTLFLAHAFAGPSRDPRVERMTANVLREAIGLAVPQALQSPRAPPAPAASGPFAAWVSTVAIGLNGPTGLAVLADGSLAVSDVTGRVYRIGPGPDRGTTLLAGGGQVSFPSGSPGAMVQLRAPTGLAAAGSGDLYVADALSHAILRVADDAQHSVVTLAGQAGQPGFADGEGAAARFRNPGGLSLDAPRNRLLVADTGNQRIRAIDLTTGSVATLAGSGSGNADGPGATAGIPFPTGVAAAPDGRGFVVAGNAGIKVILPDAASTVVTLAGGGQGYADGTGDVARLAPLGALWAGGELLISDTANLRLRGVAPGATATSTQVWTIAGSGRSGSADGPGDMAELALPMGMAVGPDGTIYVADAASGSIRAIRR